MCEVIGVRNVSFKSREGNDISGCSVYYTYTERNVIGKAADKLFISSQTMDRINWMPAVGDTFIPLYNKYGKVSDISFQ